MWQLVKAMPDLYAEGVGLISDITHISETMVYTAGILFLIAVLILALATVAAIFWMIVKIILGIIHLLTKS